MVEEVSVPIRGARSGAKRARRRERRRAASLDLVKMRTVVGSLGLVVVEDGFDLGRGSSSSDEEESESESDSESEADEDSESLVSDPMASSEEFSLTAAMCLLWSRSTRYSGLRLGSRILMANSSRSVGRFCSPAFVPSTTISFGLDSFNPFKRLRSRVIVALRMTLRTPLLFDAGKSRAPGFTTASFSVTVSSHC